MKRKTEFLRAKERKEGDGSLFLALFLSFFFKKKETASRMEESKDD